MSEPKRYYKSSGAGDKKYEDNYSKIVFKKCSNCWYVGKIDHCKTCKNLDKWEEETREEYIEGV